MGKGIWQPFRIEIHKQFDERTDEQVIGMFSTFRVWFQTWTVIIATLMQDKIWADRERNIHLTDNNSEETSLDRLVNEKTEMPF